MTLSCFFDGSCEPINPGGNIGYGAIIKREEDVLWSLSNTWEPLTPGATSNNIAEYLGVLSILSQLINSDIWFDRTEKCVIHGDSKLVIMQLSHEWRIRNGLYERFAKRALVLLSELGNPSPVFKWIPREKNTEADDLSKRHLIDKGIKIKDWSNR